MGKGHKLIPYILPHLSDDRDLAEDLKQKKIKAIQSTPGSFAGMGAGLGKTMTIGFTAAMTLQSLVMLDVERSRWVGGKARERIVDYLLHDLQAYGDEFAIKNGLWAVAQIHDKRLVPFWFQCLETESMRTAALFGLYFYVYDRTHGLFTWHPEEEIDANMIENLKSCLTDHADPHVRMSALRVADALSRAGLGTIHADNEQD